MKIYKILISFFSFLIITLLFNIVSQLIRNYKIIKVIKKTIFEYDKIKNDKEKYSIKLDKINTKDGLEAAARKKLGMIKPGDKLYKIIEEKKEL